MDALGIGDPGAAQRANHRRGGRHDLQPRRNRDTGRILPESKTHKKYQSRDHRRELAQAASLLKIDAAEVDACIRFVSTSRMNTTKTKRGDKVETCLRSVSSSQELEGSIRGIASRFGERLLDGPGISIRIFPRSGSIIDSKRPSRNGTICCASSIASIVQGARTRNSPAAQNMKCSCKKLGSVPGFCDQRSRRTWLPRTAAILSRQA